MGASTYLYFATFKHLGILLAILTVVYSIFSLITNIIAASQNNGTGSSAYTVDYLTISLSSKETNDTSQNELYYLLSCCFGAGAMLIWIIVIIAIKYSEAK